MFQTGSLNPRKKTTLQKQNLGYCVSLVSRAIECRVWRERTSSRSKDRQVQSHEVPSVYLFSFSDPQVAALSKSLMIAQGSMGTWKQTLLRDRLGDFPVYFTEAATLSGNRRLGLRKAADVGELGKFGTFGKFGNCG